MLSASLLLQHRQRLSTVSSVAPLLLKAFRKKEKKKVLGSSVKKRLFFLLFGKRFLSLFQFAYRQQKPSLCKEGLVSRLWLGEACAMAGVTR